MRRVWVAAVLGVTAVVGLACGIDGAAGNQGSDAGRDIEEPSFPTEPDPPNTPSTDAGGDAGVADAGEPDAGPRFDGGDPPDTPLDAGVGPWPDEPVVDFSDRFKVGTPQDIGVDEGHNLWLLDGNRIGVLRAGATEPVWTSNVGQASGYPSTVICGGAAGRAYVGYAAPESPAFIYSPDGCAFPGYTDCDPSRFSPEDYGRYQEGDLDAVRLQPDGKVALEEHIQRTPGPDGVYRGPQDIGIRNTNDHHFDEDRTVLSCARVMRGRDRGELYIGTNHGVSRIKGLEYNSHRHPVWFEEVCDANGCRKSQRAGLSYALGIAPNGDVLIGNDWNVGVVTPNADFRTWDNVSQTVNPEKLNSYVSGLNSLSEKDFWRGFQQTTDGRYFAASKDYGLWQITIVNRNEERSTKVPGLPTDKLTSLAATDDGSLFIGTDGSGLWRLPKGLNQAPVRVSEVEGSRVLELLYDPTVQPAMLYALTSSGLTVLRGY